MLNFTYDMGGWGGMGKKTLCVLGKIITIFNVPVILLYPLPLWETNSRPNRCGTVSQKQKLLCK